MNSVLSIVEKVLARAKTSSDIVLAVVMTVIPLVVLVVHSVMQHRAILRGVAQQRAREARLRAAQQQEAA